MAGVIGGRKRRVRSYKQFCGILRGENKMTLMKPFALTHSFDNGLGGLFVGAGGKGKGYDGNQAH